jgi:hypothetical protein
VVGENNACARRNVIHWMLSHEAARTFGIYLNYRESGWRICPTRITTGGFKNESNWQPENECLAGIGNSAARRSANFSPMEGNALTLERQIATFQRVVETARKVSNDCCVSDLRQCDKRM